MENCTVVNLPNESSHDLNLVTMRIYCNKLAQSISLVTKESELENVAFVLFGDDIQDFFTLILILLSSLLSAFIVILRPETFWLEMIIP